jgi:Chaperone of endosialidase
MATSRTSRRRLDEPRHGLHDQRDHPKLTSSYVCTTDGKDISCQSRSLYVTAASSDRIVSGTTSVMAVSNTGFISVTQSGVNTGWFDPQAALDVSGSIFHSGIITDLSDRRMKQNVQPISSTLRNVLSLLPVSYQKKATPALTEYGFVAQDVLPVFPNLVSVGKDPSQTMSLNYVGMISPIVRAMQEMKADNDNTFDALKKQNQQLMSDTKALKDQLKAANDNYAELRQELER